jgi:hypothetical protein
LRTRFFDGSPLRIVLSCICFGFGGGLLALGFGWLPAAFGSAN